MADKDLEELKKEKMQKIRQAQQGSSQGGGDVREQLKKIASQILTREARSRLGNIRAAKPELASRIEMQLVQLYKMGQIKDKITDEQLKELLKRLRDSGESRNIKY